MKKSSEDKNSIRRRIIGLGEDSIHKSYFPQLQQHISELEQQKKEIELKNFELTETMHALEKTQEQLIKSEKKYRILFENANDAIFIQNSDFKFVDCNAQALELYDIDSKEELLKKTPENISPTYQPNGEESIPVGKKKQMDALNGLPQTFEWVFLLKRDKPKHCLVSLNCFELSGKKYLQSIVRDVTEKKKLEHELGLATIKTEEKERIRFAKELHDGIGPILSTIKLYMQWLEETDDESHKKVIIEKANANIIEAIKSLKEVSNNLSPHILTNYGLVVAIEQFVERIIITGKIKISFQNNLTERFNSDIEIIIYRTVTELISNTLKHAEASQIRILLKKENTFLKLSYKDDGKGFDPDDKTLYKTGLGIHNIQNRVQNIGGSINIKSKPGQGFKLSLIIEDFEYNNGY